LFGTLKYLPSVSDFALRGAADLEKDVEAEEGAAGVDGEHGSVHHRHALRLFVFILLQRQSRGAGVRVCETGLYTWQWGERFHTWHCDIFFWR
jgi:hypothetical protein